MLPLKLVSYNIHKGSQKEMIIENMMNFAREGVRIFCLQELRVPKDDEFMGDTILKALGPGWQGEFFLSSRANNPDCGLGFIWHTDVVQPVKFQKIPLPKLGKLKPHQKLFALAFVRDKVYPIQRGSFIGTFRFQDKLLRISNIHLDYQGGFQHRYSQLQHLIQGLKTEPFDEVEVICGDFNTLGLLKNSQQMRQIQELLGAEFINSYPEFRITTAHYQHLDHVFTRNIKAIESKVYQWPGSDHYPVLVSLNYESKL